MKEDPSLKKEFDEKEPKKADIEKKIDTILEKTKISFNILCDEIKRELINQDVTEKNSENLADLAFEKAVEIERMFNALKGHHGLEDYNKEGHCLQSGLIRIDFSDGKDFLLEVLEKSQPKTKGYKDPKQWNAYTERRQPGKNLFELKSYIKEKFELSLYIFSRILKQQLVPVKRWSSEKKEWERCEILLSS